MAKLPLEGVRVVDLTVVWAAPYGTMILGDLGAEVIRVESIRRWPYVTRGPIARPPKELVPRMGAVVGGYPDKDPGERPWNRHAMFNCHGRKKYSMTTDLTTEIGKEVFKRLVRVSDVVVENNAYGMLSKLGLGYEDLRQEKPDIIMVSSNGMGQSGEWRNLRGFGLQFEAISGHVSVIGYPDMDPTGAPSTVAGDGAAGPAIAFAVMAALRHRNRTGEGQYVDLAQAENFINHLAEQYMDYTMNGRVAGPTANRQVYFAPQGCYPCRGDDRWINISIRTDEEWQALRTVMGDPGWARSSRFDTVTGRYHYQDALDQHIIAWTREQDDHDLFHRLQAAGIAAGPLFNERDAYEDEHAQARGYFVPIYQEDCGTHLYPGPLFRMSETPFEVRKPPVRLGEDNEYVYNQLLGFSDEEYNAMVADGLIGEVLSPEIH